MSYESLLAIDDEAMAAIASSFENGGHARFLITLKAEIEKMTEGRYPAGEDMPEPLRELKAADEMCRDLIDCLEKRPGIWPAMWLESENASLNFMVPMLLALFLRRDGAGRVRDGSGAGCGRRGRDGGRAYRGYFLPGRAGAAGAGF